MSPDLAIFLAIISIALAGDPVAGTWSIGGEYKPTLGLLGRATGIAGTHNQYESDASIVRGDAYLNGGNVGVFQMREYTVALELDGICKLTRLRLLGELLQHGRGVHPRPRSGTIGKSWGMNAVQTSSG